MFRVLTLVIALMASGCSRPNRPSWLIESEDAGIIKVRVGEKAYTGVCEHRVVLGTLTVREGPSSCEIAPTIAGKMIPTENRERDSIGQVVVTKLTIVRETRNTYRVVLRRFREKDPSGGVYESYRVVPDGYRPEKQPFTRPVYIWEQA